MTLTSPIFVFLFLPVVLAGHFVVPQRFKNVFLLLASLLFYAWGEGKYVFVLLFLIFANYILGILVGKYRDEAAAKYIVCASIIINVGALFVFKYFSFFLGKLSVSFQGVETPLLRDLLRGFPLGISFYTFQAIAYVLDIYRDEIKPQKVIHRFALFMALFPKIAAGPIIRYAEVANNTPLRMPRSEFFASGVKRFVFGLGKKVLMADTLAKTADQIFAIPTAELTASIAWLGIVCYTLQIYLDFSGYSDMAIGLGRMFGFEFQENFNYPYISRSLTEFWRRWHISLSTWLRDYVFIPMNYALMTESVRRRMAIGKYNVNYRTLFSIVAVFTLCGLWHGAGWNYITWGMLHGIVLGIESMVLEKTIKKWWLPLQHCYFIFVIVISWIFFRISAAGDIFRYLSALVGLSASSGLSYNINMYMNGELALSLFFSVLATIPVSTAVKEYFEERSYFRLNATIEVTALIVIIAASFASIACSTFSPFIYQQY